MLEKDTLKSIFLNPDWFVEIYITNDFSPTLRLQYFGNIDFGAFHLHCERLLTEQKKLKYVPLKTEIWLGIIEDIENFMEIDIAEIERDSGWAVNAIYSLKVKTPSDSFEIDLIVEAPNKTISNFINKLIDSCQILINQGINQYYYC